MTKKDVLKPQLWTPRPVAETIAVYADWAETYDAEVEKRGYRTPERLSKALADVIDLSTTVLDFGCGTGLSGIALKDAGFQTLHGTDVTSEMLEKATAIGLYEKTWVSTPEDPAFGKGAYKAIAAIGVVSLGAAPPETLAMLVGKLNTGNILAMSYNEPTLRDVSYIKALDDEVASGHVEVIFRENGPHLEDVGMTSDVIILRHK
ncbi:class I SAM-dependent DNA methyltransferase [Cognatiyoonia sp.]|uniref:class I SAM-dependent DNA methyltransferase n=1 Tax=Cognatiyoonia sp. TaxID=2211652 RepID=UPI003F69E03E